jgi:23S rRNA-/tRNA-specific pseudouridylate synthase
MVMAAHAELGLHGVTAAAVAQHACGSSLSHARLAQLSFGVERSILTADEARELIVEQPWLLSSEFATSYEDDHLVVANKPWDVHLGPDKGGQPRWAGERNLRDWLAHEYPSTTTPDGEVRLCHNLDFATSGLICAATSRVAANDVSRCFRDRVARKLYVALCHGHPAWSSARWEARIQPSTRKFKQRISGGGKKALTDVSVAARGTLRVGEHKGNAACLLWLQPHTGRRHQCAAHAPQKRTASRARVHRATRRMCMARRRANNRRTLRPILALEPRRVLQAAAALRARRPPDRGRPHVHRRPAVLPYVLARGGARAATRRAAAQTC